MSSPARTRTRRIRNFLIEPSFQIKYAAWVAALSILLAGVTGFFLWRSQQALVTEAERAVEARSRAAQASRELGQTVLSSELLKRFDDPTFAAQLQTESRKIDARYDDERSQIVAQQESLGRWQRQVLLTLILAFAALIGLGVLGTIVLTHRIVGPVYRLKRMVRDVGEGNLEPPPHGLRPGDEFKDLFELFASMVATLRSDQERHALKAREAVSTLERTGAPPEALEAVRALEQSLKTRVR